MEVICQIINQLLIYTRTLPAYTKACVARNQMRDTSYLKLSAKRSLEVSISIAEKAIKEPPTISLLII